ncbi:MAG: aromatic-ring-hydroxylating dioxygenase subunit beta [Alphaproteobacteria bacterium]|jgi:3-phenylpropionate/cinnamic acid dioxygenase small subunit
MSGIINPVSAKEWRDIRAFIYLEARLADESEYGAWEALLTDDVHYWVPYGKANYEPDSRISFINDNRHRLATRIRQLQTGHRHAQTPASSMRRMITNLELLEQSESGYVVAGNFVLYEHAIQATHNVRVWAGRVTYGLRRTDDGLRMSRKVVELVNSTEALPTLAFLI